MRNYFFSARSRAILDSVHPDLQSIAERALSKSKIDFGIPKTGGLRTADFQHSLYLKGMSKADGYVKQSAHQSGNALDFYAFVDGKASWEKEHLAHVACAFFEAASELNIRIRWGGLFTTIDDYPHIELVPE